MDATTPNKTGITLKDLLDAGLHFGHQTKRWNPKMRPYIFDKRNGIHIIDLTQTIGLIDEAADFLQKTVREGKKVLFVATKKQAQEVVRTAAESCGQFHMTNRWLGGTLTNMQTIRRSIRRMRQIETIGRNNNGVLSPFKKEAATLRRELDKLQTNLGGIADLNGLPGALVVVDVVREANAVKEAATLGIPVVAIVDTNANPDPIDYVIPGNDDAVRGVKIIVDGLAAAIKTAADEYAKVQEEERAKKAAEAPAEGRKAPRAPRRPGERAPRRPAVPRKPEAVTEAPVDAAPAAPEATKAE